MALKIRSSCAVRFLLRISIFVDPNSRIEGLISRILHVVTKLPLKPNALIDGKVL